MNQSSSEKPKTRQTQTTSEVEASNTTEKETKKQSDEKPKVEKHVQVNPQNTNKSDLVQTTTIKQNQPLKQEDARTKNTSFRPSH